MAIHLPPSAELFFLHSCYLNALNGRALLRMGALESSLNKLATSIRALESKVSEMEGAIQRYNRRSSDLRSQKILSTDEKAELAQISQKSQSLQNEIEHVNPRSKIKQLKETYKTKQEELDAARNELNHSATIPAPQLL